MRFWDSSALVPLVVEEAASAACRRLIRGDPNIVVWMLSRVEIASAIHRKVRGGQLGRIQGGAALQRLESLAARWTEVEAVGEVRERAERLLGAHGLAAADALQLAAALLACDERPRRRGFVCRDQALAEAAAAEGFGALFPS